MLLMGEKRQLRRFLRPMVKAINRAARGSRAAPEGHGAFVAGSDGGVGTDGAAGAAACASSDSENS